MLQRPRHTYPVQVFWDADDDGFIAIAPDLPGCSAFGQTQEEAVRELQDAVDVWIEGAKAVGNPVPSPSPWRPLLDRRAGEP